MSPPSIFPLHFFTEIAISIIMQVKQHVQPMSMGIIVKNFKKD